MSNQNVIADENSSTADGDVGHSNKKTLKRAFPKALQHQDAPTTNFKLSDVDAGESAELTAPGYKESYVNFIMSGIKKIPGSDFSQVDLDYGTNAATPKDKQPPKEVFEPKLPAGHDNTIAEGGMGPNSATLDLDNTENPGTGRPMVNAGSVSGAPFLTPAETKPFQSSVKTSAGGAHGGTGASRGVEGDSAVTLGLE